MSLRGDQLLLVWNAPSVLLTAFLILIVAYAIFSLMGFGTALWQVPRWHG